jgi:hypothetical protein
MQTDNRNFTTESTEDTENGSEYRHGTVTEQTTPTTTKNKQTRKTKNKKTKEQSR